MTKMMPETEIDCDCLGCRATTVANKAILLLIELERIADEVMESGSDGVALMAAKDVAHVRDHIVRMFMAQPDQVAAN